MPLLWLNGHSDIEIKRSIHFKTMRHFLGLNMNCLKFKHIFVGVFYKLKRQERNLDPSCNIMVFKKEKFLYVLFFNLPTGIVLHKIVAYLAIHYKRETNLLELVTINLYYFVH